MPLGPCRLVPVAHPKMEVVPPWTIRLHALMPTHAQLPRPQIPVQVYTSEFKCEWPTIHQGDPTPPTTPLLDPADGAHPAADIYDTIRLSEETILSKSRLAITVMAETCGRARQGRGLRRASLQGRAYGDEIRRLQYVVANHAPR